MDRKRIFAVLLMLVFAAGGLWAEFVPVTVDETLYIVDTENGRIVSYAFDGEIVAVPEKSTSEAISISTPEWLQGCWIDSEYDKIILITEDDIFIEGQSLRNSVAYYGSDYKAYGYDPVDFMAKEISDESFLIFYDGSSVIFRKTANPHLIMCHEDRYTSILYRYETAHSLDMAIPGWLQGAWKAGGGYAFVTDKDIFIFEIGSDRGVFALSEDLLSGSLFNVGQAVFYMPMASFDSTDDAYTISFGNQIGTVSRTDDPDVLEVSGELFGDVTFNITRQTPTLSFEF